MAAETLTDAPARGWGQGYPTCEAKAHLGTARGGGIALPVRVELVELVSWLLDETVKLGYRLDQSQCGAYNCRGLKLLSGGYSDKPSNHSWALALDLNWRANGFGHGATYDLPPEVVALWQAHGFNWGGHWTAQSPDYMHFEFNGTPADAARITAALKTGGSTTTTQGDLVLDDATQGQLKLLLAQSNIETWQLLLNSRDEPWATMRKKLLALIAENVKS